MEGREYKKSRRRSARLKHKTSGADTCIYKADKSSVDVLSPCRHGFSSSDIATLRQLLLNWYSLNKRQLPWRSSEIHSNPNVRFYAVWVSEVMLQQTQVVTVFEYYNRWMKRWPTLAELSKASLEDVNQLWSGLGYYSRAKRLLETSQLIETKLNGVAPQNAAALQKLPGIGQYTACAIASIAFNEVKGVVDGNVMRVLTRLRMVGADVNQRIANDWLWKSVNLLVDPNQPGDFNQALMEFGATVCTPKNPSCSACPLQSHCWAFEKFAAAKQEFKTVSGCKNHVAIKKTETADIECDFDCDTICYVYTFVSFHVSVLLHAVPNCEFCIQRSEFDFSLGVLNYPHKGKKKAPREDHVAVAIPYRKGLPPNVGLLEYFMVKRPEKGLLASLWEFPNVVIDKSESDENQKKTLLDALKIHFTNSSTIKCADFKMMGQVLHIFSHIRCTYIVYTVEMTQNMTSCDRQSTQWITGHDLQTSAISTAMRKVFKVLKVPSEESLVSRKTLKISKKRKRNGSITKNNGIKQTTLDKFRIFDASA